MFCVVKLLTEKCLLLIPVQSPLSSKHIHYSLSEDFGRQGYLWHEKEKKKRDKLVLENIGAFNL